MSPFPFGWRWFNPLWWVRTWREHRRWQAVRLSWIGAYFTLCRDDLEPADRLYWKQEFDRLDAEMDKFDRQEDRR